MSEIWTSPLLRRALVEAVLVGAIGGVVGVHVVLRRFSYATAALTHATFPGVVLAVVVGLDLLVGSLVFGMVTVTVLALLWRGRRVGESTIVGVVLSASLAIGVVIAAAEPTASRLVSRALVGSILTVDAADLWLTAGLGLLAITLVVAVHKELVASSFDPEGSRAAGYKMAVLDGVLLVAVQLALVAAVPAVGTLLAVALLVGPAATARLWVERIGRSMVAAAAIGAVCGAAGVWVSHTADVAAGGAIATICGSVFMISLVGSRAIVRTRANSARRRALANA